MNLAPKLLLLAAVAFPLQAPAVPVERLPPERAVQALFDAQRPALQRCYERQLKRKPGSVDLVVALSVSRAGRVRSVKVVERPRDRLGGCITANLRGQRLPRLTRAARVEVPLRLRPSDG